MKVQTLYIVAGLVWGLVMGPDAGLYAARVMGSVAWLYKYEDGAWANLAIFSFGTVIGLTVLFACYQAGAAAGRRYDDMSEFRLRHTKSLPWALVVAGAVVGTITALTVEDRRVAVVNYVEMQKEAIERLYEIAEIVHGVAGYEVEWPGGGENGRINLSFIGKRRGEYWLDWVIMSAEGQKPLLGDRYRIRLGKEYKRTSIPISADGLVNAYMAQMKEPGAAARVDERFRLELRMSPVFNSKQWQQLPEGEEERMEEGESILIRRTEARFKVQFELQGGRVNW